MPAPMPCGHFTAKIEGQLRGIRPSTSRGQPREGPEAGGRAGRGSGQTPWRLPWPPCNIHRDTQVQQEAFPEVSGLPATHRGPQAPEPRGNRRGLCLGLCQLLCCSGACAAGHPRAEDSLATTAL